MKPSAFVIMPFDAELDDVYDYLIRGPLSEAGYDVKRADDLLNQQNILEDILLSIVKSDLIVADLSKANPNVYYELGLAHVYGKKVILLAQDIDEVPFDLRSYRVITYNTHYLKMNDAREEIQTLIEGVQADNVKFGSPVTDFGLPFPDLSTSGIQSQVVSDEQDDRGSLDYQVELVESMEIITQVVTGVGDRLKPLTLEMESAVERLTGSELGAPRKQRKTMQSLAVELDKYTSWLREGNNQYRQALGSMGQSINAILSGEFEFSEEDRAALGGFVQELNNAENAMQEAHFSFSDLVANMDVFPRIEREFHHSKQKMAEELKIFIDNIEQTESVIARTRNAAKRILDPS